jgi:hypothetical protein
MCSGDWYLGLVAEAGTGGGSLEEGLILGSGVMEVVGTSRRSFTKVTFLQETVLLLQRGSHEYAMDGLTEDKAS